MHRLRLIPLALLTFVGSCAAPPDEGADTATSDVVRAYVAGVCARPLTSSDGAYAFVVDCSYGRRTLTMMTTATGRRRTILSLPVGDELVGINTGAAPISNGAWVSWITKHPAGDWDVTAVRFDDPSRRRVVKPVFPAGASPDAVMPPREGFQTAITDRHIVLVPGDREQAFVVAAELDTDRPPVVLALAQTHARVRLFASPDGNKILVARPGSAQIADAPLQTLELDWSAPRLLAPVTIDASAMQVSLAQHATFDGRRMVVTGKLSDGSATALGVLSTLTGSIGVVPTSIWGVSVLGARGSTVWYTARTREGSGPSRSVIERLDLVAPLSPRRLYDSDALLTGRMSRDATNLLVVVDRGVSRPRDVLVMPTDGATPPRTVHEGVDVRLGVTNGGRHLATLDGQSVLLDEITGAVTASYPRVYWPTLGGDGATVYEERGCDLGDLRGREVVRYRGDERVVVPCRPTAGTGDELLPIPGSSSVFHFHPTQTGELRGELMLVSP